MYIINASLTWKGKSHTNCRVTFNVSSLHEIRILIIPMTRIIIITTTTTTTIIIIIIIMIVLLTVNGTVFGGFC